jgi:hypothetical protein
MEDINIGHLLKSERYNNYFFSIANDENGKPNVFLYTLIDDVKKIYDTKNIEIKYDNHNIKLDSIMCLSDVFNCRVPFYELCRRADSFNKKILAFVGKRGRNEKIYLVQCIKCGYKAHQYMRKFFKCNGCKDSKGEISVAKYLNACGETFISQHKFQGCLHKRFLKFDFYLSERNMLIEFDGEGHYMAIFGSTHKEKQKNLEDCKKRDNIKNEWALTNNIPLLRIPYWDYDRIEELIEAFILEHKRKELNQLVMDI